MNKIRLPEEAIKLETQRFYLRELKQEDESDLFELDSDPEVHRYIENTPVKDIETIRNVIKMVQLQYLENGIGRWAVIDKLTGECVGWAGFKYFREQINKHKDIYELGYRFKQKHWGKGIATETSRALLNYVFKNLNVATIYAYTHPENEKSIHVLEKIGFEFVEQFEEDGALLNWFENVKR